VTGGSFTTTGTRRPEQSPVYCTGTERQTLTTSGRGGTGGGGWCNQPRAASLVTLGTMGQPLRGETHSGTPGPRDPIGRSRGGVPCLSSWTPHAAVTV
jgi:hypothetical protein